MPYLYRHIRLDKNEVFYIGVGTKDNPKYSRAYNKQRRSRFWKEIVKNTQYRIEILFENLTLEQVCEKEKEFISLYGRRDLNQETLCNLTDGGEGISGFKHSENHKQQLKLKLKGSGNPNSKPCIHFDTGIKYNSLKEACELLKLNYQKQLNSIRNQYSTAQFYFINNKFKRKTRRDVSLSLSNNRIGNTNSIRYSVKYLPTEVIYESLTDACKKLNLKYNTEYNRLKNNLIDNQFEYV